VHSPSGDLEALGDAEVEQLTQLRDRVIETGNVQMAGYRLLSMSLPKRQIRKLRNASPLREEVAWLSQDAARLLLGAIGVAGALLAVAVLFHGDRIGCPSLSLRSCPAWEASMQGCGERFARGWGSFYSPGYVGGGAGMELDEDEEVVEEAGRVGGPAEEGMRLISSQSSQIIARVGAEEETLQQRQQLFPIPEEEEIE